MRSFLDRLTSHPAFAGFATMGVGFIIAIALLANQQGDLRSTQRDLRRITAEACADRKQQWNALRGVIVKQNAQQPASAIILRAFPQFAPFYNPGTPEFKEAKRIADTRRDQALTVLGTKPDC